MPGLKEDVELMKKLLNKYFVELDILYAQSHAAIEVVIELYAKINGVSINDASSYFGEVLKKNYDELQESQLAHLMKTHGKFPVN